MSSLLVQRVFHWELHLLDLYFTERLARPSSRNLRRLKTLRSFWNDERLGHSLWRGRFR